MSANVRFVIYKSHHQSSHLHLVRIETALRVTVEFLSLRHIKHQQKYCPINLVFMVSQNEWHLFVLSQQLKLFKQFLEFQILVDDFSKMPCCELYLQEWYKCTLQSCISGLLLPLPLHMYTLRDYLIQREQLNFLKSAHQRY